MNYSSNFISALAMMPTYILTAIWFAMYPFWVWIIAFLLVSHFCSWIYDKIIINAELNNRNPIKPYITLVLFQILIYVFVIYLIYTN